MNTVLTRNIKTCILIVIACLIALSVSCMKYRGGDINYVNSDATWHSMLTLQAYGETSPAVHKFLPLVTLGASEDKYISWGSAIPDKHGNYYYTSFSAAGYALPYAFIRLFGLPVSERSLYIFGSFLYVISASLWGLFLFKIFGNFFAGLAGAAAYVFSPEIMHGMGVAYWHHSVMQVALILQAFAYYLYRTEGSKTARNVFLFLCAVNPYIEWTGYTANAGYMAAEIFSPHESKESSWKNARLIFGLTVLSGVLFCLHYLVNTRVYDFLLALAKRFFARNFAGSLAREITGKDPSFVMPSFFDLAKGYAHSFAFLWVLPALLFIVNCIIYRSFSWLKECITAKRFWLVIILAAPLIENIIMKEHAVSYAFDRMKGIFLLSFVICDFSCAFIRGMKAENFGRIILACLIGIVCFMNYREYAGNEAYIWHEEYRKSNRAIAEYISSRYTLDNSVIGLNNSVRGYITLLFERGVHELVDIDDLKKICAEKGKRYAVLLVPSDRKVSGSMTELSGAVIYDTEEGRTEYYNHGDNK